MLEKLISIIAPVTCVGCNIEGTALCEACLTSEILPFGERCWRCNKLEPSAGTCSSCKAFRGPSKVWISSEYSGLSKEVIKAYKFNHLRPLAKQMAVLMVETLRQYNQDSSLIRANYLLVPVPTASSRRRERGFGHAELLAKEAAKCLGEQHNNDLKRLGHVHQIGSTRGQRLKQPAGQYYVSGASIKGRNILLIDDVVTTGATLKEAKRVLKAAGARRVDALVFAKRL